LPRIPPDYRPIKSFDETLARLQPIYLRATAENQVVFGFYVEQQHCNPNGSCHGGTWAALADVLMGMNMGLVSGLTGPTISMSLAYVGAGTPGQWVEGAARILRCTPKLGFAECHFTADGEIALRADAIFRRRSPPAYALATDYAEQEPE